MLTALEATINALHTAISTNDTNLGVALITLLDNQTTYDTKPLKRLNEHGQSILCLAAMRKNRVIEDFLWSMLEKRTLDSFEDHVFTADRIGRNIFWHAAESGNHYTLARVIHLSKKSVIHKNKWLTRTHKGELPIHAAAKNHRLKCCEILIKAMRKGNQLDLINEPVNNETLLHTLCLAPAINPDIIALLINADANFTTLNLSGNTPISFLLMKSDYLTIIDRVFIQLNDSKRVLFWDYLKKQGCKLSYITAGRLSLQELLIAHLSQNPDLKNCALLSLKKEDQDLYHRQQFLREDLKHINHALDLINQQLSRLKHISPKCFKLHPGLLIVLLAISSVFLAISIMLSAHAASFLHELLYHNINPSSKLIKSSRDLVIAFSILGGASLFTILFAIFSCTPLNKKILSHSNWHTLFTHIDTQIVSLLANSDNQHSLSLSDEQVDLLVDELYQLKKNLKHADITHTLNNLFSQLTKVRAEIVKQQKPLPGHFRLFDNNRRDGFARGSTRIIELETEMDNLEDSSEHTTLLTNS